MKSFYVAYHRLKSKLRHIGHPVPVHFSAEARYAAPRSIFVRLNDNRYRRARAYHNQLPRVTSVSSVAAAGPRLVRTLFIIAAHEGAVTPRVYVQLK